jgi:hypothetical protein
MTFGFGVSGDGTFVADLAATDPEADHVNAGVIGTGPDDYLLVLRRWLKEGPVQQAVMYLFEGNDLSEIDKGHPCSDWQSILTFEGGEARLRFPDGPHEQHALWERLRATSPPPFLVRALARESRVAEFIALAMSRLRTPDVNANEPDEVRWTHLDSILRAAQRELAAQGGSLAVVVLPLVKGPTPGEIETRMVTVARQVGVPVLDAGDLIRGAIARGESVFVSQMDLHYGPRGHRLVADWLHDQLPRTAAPAPPR